MSALEKKLVRDLWRLKGQVATIALVLACGVMAMVMMRSTWQSLLDARDHYYNDYRFGDAFAHLERAPEAVARRLERLPGVALVVTRLSEEVMVPVPGDPEPAIGRIVSIPDAGETPLGALYLRAGRLPDAGVPDEAVILESFALARGMAPGDHLPVVIAGKLRQIHVTGIALSPEYVFATAGREVIPDNSKFVVAWMRRGTIARAFAMEGAFDDLVFRLEPGASVPGVLDAIDRELARYGGRHAVGRDKQISNYILTMRLDILRTIAVVIPVAFLLVAAFLVNVVISRLVFLERTQIAVLKALGFSNTRVALHYLGLVALIVVLGAIAGVASGWRFGAWMSDLYAKFYQFPVRTFRVEPGLIATTTCIGLAAAVGGALGAVRRVAVLPPAEAMRPPSPLLYKRSLLERIGLARAVGPSTMMVVREIQRRPVRFAFSTAGIAMGIAIFIAGRFSTDSFDYLMEHNFPLEQRQDLTVAFIRALPASALSELAHEPGVIGVEGQRVVPVRVRFGTHWRDTAVTGIPADATLRTLYDAGAGRVALPDRGLVMGKRLAGVLGVSLGDQVELELLEGDFTSRVAPVVGLVDEAFGIPIYARADWLGQLVHEQPRVTTALLAVERSSVDAVSARLQRFPQVLSVTSQARIVDNYRSQIGGSMLIMTLILTFSAAAIATGVVYNNARIALSMRSRDLATLRVLGFDRREVSAVLLGELGAQVAVGIPLGLIGGRAWAHWMAQSIASESFHFPPFVSATTYVSAALIALVSGILSALFVRRRLDELDLVAVLKSAD